MSDPVVLGAPAAAGCRVFLCTAPDELARQFAQLLRFIVELRWQDSARQEVDLHIVVVVA